MQLFQHKVLSATLLRHFALIILVIGLISQSMFISVIELLLVINCMFYLCCYLLVLLSSNKKTHLMSKMGDPIKMSVGEV